MWEMILKRYWQVTLLKESPENTPYSPFLLVIVATLFLLLIIVQWYFSDLKQKFDLLTSSLAGLTLVFSYFFYTYILLALFKQLNRALQTLTTLLACHMIVHFFAFPLLMTAPLLVNSKLNHTFGLFVSIIYLVFTLLLTIWQFLLTINIFKQALSSDYLSATLASFGLLACNILTVSFWQ